MLYEDPTKDISSDERFHVELHFSPGVNCCVQKELPPGPGFRPHSRSKGSHSYADFDLEPALATPPPPLVCSIKCSKDSFANVFEKSSCCGQGLYGEIYFLIWNLALRSLQTSFLLFAFFF